jgi:rSAM/selenodomain-associated transferase 2
MISIIIPVYNEEVCLLRNGAYYVALASAAELIFADGGSTDRTVELARQYGRVITAPKNRAVQMNTGAREAHRKILLFLHADALLRPEDLRHVVSAVERDHFVGGCFSQVLDDPAFVYRWIAWTGNVRAKIFKIFYGDQSIFVRTDIFEELGGFPLVRIGEDVLFSRALRKKGRAIVLTCPVQCSARRWKRQGILKTFFLNARITAALTWNRDLEFATKVYKDVRE